MLADVRPEAVLHFAAKSLVGESQQQPEDYWHTNVGGSLALLEAMRAADCRRIVFSSTAATYGEPESVPIREDAPTRPTNTYGASKLAVDHMLTSYAVAHGFAAVSLRYFNVAGAAFGLGERHATETHLIPIALQVAAGQRESLTVFGDDYPTPDGTCIRDYVHVADLADAHLLALPAPAAGEHRIYNLGNGTGLLGPGGRRRRPGGHRAPGAGRGGRAPGRRPGAAGRLERPDPRRPGLDAAAHRPGRHRPRRLGRRAADHRPRPRRSAEGGLRCGCLVVGRAARAAGRPAAGRCAVRRAPATVIVRPSTSMVSPTSGSRPSSAST